MRKLIYILPVVLMLVAGSAFAGAIHDLVEQGDYGQVKKALKENPGLINEQDEAGSTPLHIAAINGHKKIAKYLLKKGADLEAGDNEYTPPLQVAAQNGHKELVDLFLKKGADINFHDDNGYTALHWAAYFGHIAVAEALIKAGADLNARKSGGSVPLHGAAFYGHPEMVRLLIARGAEIDARNEAQYTPMLSGAANGQLENVKMLLDKGADLDACTSWNADALCMAADAGNVDLVNLLLERGAKVVYEDPERRNPLINAAWSGNLEIAQVLVDHGADINARMPNGMSALHMAAHNDQTEMVNYLIEHGADLDVTTNDGDTPLNVATKKGRSEVAKALIDAGANPDIPENFFGKSPLMVVSAFGYQDIAEMLIDGGANLNAADREGRTALNYASTHGNVKLADVLKQNGGDYGDCKKKCCGCGLVTKSLEEGEAVVWYLGHCSFGIKTQNHFMVFDYWNRWREADQPCLANGYICPEEMGDQNLEVFVTHDHGDHFDTTTFAWYDQVDNIQYIYGFKPEESQQYRTAGYNGPEYYYTGPREVHDVDGMKITTIRSNDGGVGFLVETDGVKLWHAGDHAGWDSDETKAEFIDEIDWLAERVDNVDFAFVNVTGCRHSGHPEELYEGNLYTVQKLSPKVLVPTHGIHNEQTYCEYADRIDGEKLDLEVFAAQNKGDHYVMFNEEGEKLSQAQ